MDGARSFLIMKTLVELIELVKEENLSKDMLESYHTEITYLDNILRLELAPIEKEEALYFEENKYENRLVSLNQYEQIVKSDIQIKRKWRATEKGQRQIELSHYLKITPKLLQSIKTRLYNIY